MPTFPVPEGTELVEAIGAGSVFDVATVRDGSGVVLVCKRLRARLVREPAARDAIVREAKLLALARHASLPALVRVGSDAHGPFLLETRAGGASLRAIVEGSRYLGRPTPPLLVRHLARAAAQALVELHELADEEGPLAVVHGDLGPDHVLMGPIGQVRFVDFGASRFRGMEAPDADDRGTLPFVAPEVARGEARPSQAADVYALAATIAFLALGEPPCDAREEAAALAEIGARGLDLGRLDAATALEPGEREAVRAALAFDPARRLATARAFAAALGV